MLKSSRKVEVVQESWSRAGKNWGGEKYEMALTGLRINPKGTFMPCIFFRFRLVSHTRRRKKISHEEGHGGCPLHPCLFPSLLPPVKVHGTNDSVLNYCWRADAKRLFWQKDRKEQNMWQCGLKNWHLLCILLKVISLHFLGTLKISSFAWFENEKCKFHSKREWSGQF